MYHAKWVYATHRSVMQTEAGKIQGALWGWGTSQGETGKVENRAGGLKNVPLSRRKIARPGSLRPENYAGL